MKYITASLIAVLFGAVTYFMGTFTVGVMEQFAADPTNVGLFVGCVMLGCTTLCLAIATVCMVGIELTSE